MIERFIKKTINRWLSGGKTAFLLTGARQTGKTYAIRECLKEGGTDFVELNFISNPELTELFNNVRDTKDVLRRLSIAASKRLEPGKTIFFLDEIQECRDIVTAVKFLVEEGSYRYIMSGSLLGVELNDLRSAPVGYMEVHDLYPLGFEEFARAIGVSEEIIGVLRDDFQHRTPVDSFIHSKMMDVFYLYLIIGGMPEAVQTYIDTNDLARVADVHDKIIRLYKIDFAKYEQKYKLRLREIYDAIPGQLNQQNKRFQLSMMGKGMSYNRVENDFLWLKDAGVVIPVYNVDEPKLPLIIGEKRNLFKLFCSDVGLLTSRYMTAVKMAILNKKSGINNGALFENAVAEELLFLGYDMYYFNNKRQGELDFVIERNGSITPLEIKSGKDYKRHSALNNVLSNEEYNIKEAYIFSEGNVETTEKRIYMPIYMIMFLAEDSMNNTIYRINLDGLT